MSEEHFSLQTKLERIQAWQNAGYVQELTCNRGNDHPPLEGKIQNDAVVLICRHPGCTYVQTKIPEIVFSDYLERMQERFKKTPKAQPLALASSHPSISIGGFFVTKNRGILPWFFVGGPCRARTDHPLLAKQMLYQMS